MYAIYLEMRDFSIDLRNITQLGFTRNSPGPSGQLYARPAWPTQNQIHSSHTYTRNGITRMGDPHKTRAGKSSVNGMEVFKN